MNKSIIPKQFDMETADNPNVEAGSKERDLIEKLLDSSESSAEEDFDRVVFSSSWDEVACGWKHTAPNVRYISSADRKKKTKDKYWRSSPDSESHYAKVKRLAGMITNSNSNVNSVTEINKVKAGGTWPGNKTVRTNMRNFQNADVLSYDNPCWRYIIDPRTLEYVERTPLQVLRNMTTSHKYPNQTLVLENGGMITFQETSNGSISISDPAQTFDRRLVENLDLKGEYSVDKGRFPFSFEPSVRVPLITQYRTEDHKIKVIHAVTARKEKSVVSFCDLCQLGTQDIVKPSCKLEISTNSSTELKPLQKITPIQRQTADDSLLTSKVLGSHSKRSDNSTCSKGSKKSKEQKVASQKRKFGPGVEGKLDWLPITRNTVGYPYPSTAVSQPHGKFPERPSGGFTKEFSLPKRNKKGKKLTLSEAANLVPSGGKLDDALKKLSQELDRKVEKGLSFSEPLLPSVSGTKLEVPALASMCDN